MKNEESFCAFKLLPAQIQIRHKTDILLLTSCAEIIDKMFEITLYIQPKKWRRRNLKFLINVFQDQMTLTQNKNGAKNV